MITIFYYSLALATTVYTLKINICVTSSYLFACCRIFFILKVKWGLGDLAGSNVWWLDTNGIEDGTRLKINRWVSEWLLFNANSAILQLYHDENKLIVNETMMMIFIVLAHWNNSPRVDMSGHSDTLFWFRTNQSLFLLLIPAFVVVRRAYHQTTQGIVLSIEW